MKVKKKNCLSRQVINDELWNGLRINRLDRVNMMMANGNKMGL